MKSVTQVRLRLHDIMWCKTTIIIKVQWQVKNGNVTKLTKNIIKAINFIYYCIRKNLSEYIILLCILHVYLI